MTVESYSGFAQRHNMMIGVLICGFTTSILFFIMPFGIFFMADIFLVLGCGIGLYFTFKNIKESQSHIKTGIIVGLTGSVLALFLISLFAWILYSLDFGFDFLLFFEYTLSLFLYYGIFYVAVGVMLGYLFGNYYKRRVI
ncbi:MAG: hypothetical protein KGD72_03235 [Candidatus Lokiarchaeota archaeon]|nr:hypothetical protein [Candidatus Lokiarchaeota archaeon]